MNEDKNKDQDQEEKNIVIKEGNYFEKILGNVINGDFHQVNIDIDKIKFSKKFWIILTAILILVTFPAYYSPLQSWILRNSKIEITNIEGISGDKVALLVKNSGKKPGSIGSSWLTVEDLLEKPVTFPFDNGNLINNPNLLVKSGEEKRIIIAPPKNWKNISDTSHIAKIIREDVIPCIDTPNNCKQDDLKFSCILSINVNQTGKVKPVVKEIKPKWQCLQAIGIFVNFWGNLEK